MAGHPKIRAGEVFQAITAAAALLGRVEGKHPRLSFQLGAVLRALYPLRDDVGRQEIAILTEFGARTREDGGFLEDVNAEGKPIPGTYQIEDAEKRTSARERMVALHMEELEVPAAQISIALIEQAGISVGEAESIALAALVGD